jgi:hypothetical protein
LVIAFPHSRTIRHEKTTKQIPIYQWYYRQGVRFAEVLQGRQWEQS